MPATTPASAASIRPSRLGSPLAATATAPATTTAATAERFFMAGTIMPIKVTSSAKSRPQFCGSGMRCPAMMPTTVEICQLIYMSSAEPR
jgi:hypothetical protein